MCHRPTFPILVAGITVIYTAGSCWFSGDVLENELSGYPGAQETLNLAKNKLTDISCLNAMKVELLLFWAAFVNWVK